MSERVTSDGEFTILNLIIKRCRKKNEKEREGKEIHSLTSWIIQSIYKYNIPWNRIFRHDLSNFSEAAEVVCVNQMRSYMSVRVNNYVIVIVYPRAHTNGYRKVRRKAIRGYFAIGAKRKAACKVRGALFIDGAVYPCYRKTLKVSNVLNAYLTIQNVLTSVPRQVSTQN